MTMRFGLRRNSIEPPLELVILTTSWRAAGTLIQQRGQFGAA